MADNDEDGAQLSTVDMDMAKGRPASDPVAMELARSRVELAMFGQARPARLGRYQILDPIAGGGMGLVYAAHDPELGRRVALKVLHPGRDHDHLARERLLSEARALARLDHPNVVRVHDVLTHGGQVVLVMALLDGETLAAWEATPRDWRELVAAYTQAGEGLAAAHSLEVVHRDFKPANAIISDTGEVRVLDFGLARIAPHDTQMTGSAVHGEPAMARTVSGVFVGTLAYASPEQLAGAAITPASDQFSFCVALHRAVERVAPFAGEGIDSLLQNIRQRKPRIASDGRRIPSWLRQALRRGLSVNPEHRFESMQALLCELRRPRGWKRWRWPVITALLAAGAALAAGSLHGDSEGACDGGVSALGGTWGAANRMALADHLVAIDSPHAFDVKVRAIEGLDAWARGWSAVHRATCLAHRRGEESSVLLDRKMRCLDNERDALAAAIGVLQQTTGANITRVADVVIGIPQPTWCADSARVLDDVDLPAGASLDRQVREARAQVSMAAALERDGRSQEAADMARAAIGAAERTSYQPVIAEAQLQLGRILIGQANLPGAAQVLRSALDTALATRGLSRLAVEAGARLLYAEGAQQPDLERLQRDLAFLIPMSLSLVHDQFVRPLLYNNAGEVYRIAQRIDDARRFFQLARAAVGSAQPDIELVAIDQNLATLTAQPVARLELARGVWAKTRSMLGPHHLKSLQTQAQYAIFHTDAAKAYELLAPVCDDYRHSYSLLVDILIDCEIVRGFVASELGKTDDARRAYQSIVDLTASSADLDHAMYRTLAKAELATLRDDLGQATREFQAVIEVRGQSEKWWEQQQALQAELGIGLAMLRGDRRQQAAPHLEVAATGYKTVSQLNPVIVYLRRLDKARSALASLNQSSGTR